MLNAILNEASESLFIGIKITQRLGYLEDLSTLLNTYEKCFLLWKEETKALTKVGDKVVCKTDTGVAKANVVIILAGR